MGLTYTNLSTMLHHWLIENKSFYQAVKSDPTLSMFYGNFMKHGGIGQTDIVKLHMGNTYNAQGIAEGGAFQVHGTNSGAPVVVDSSTIANRLLTSRLSMSGTQKRALEKAFDKVTGESLNDATSEFVDSFKNTLLRGVVGDGTGMLCYVTGVTSATVRFCDVNGTKLDAGHWVWNFVYPGMHLDYIVYATGVHISNGDDDIVTSVDPTTGIVGTSADVSACSYLTHVVRPATILTSTGTSATTAYFVEPNGIKGMVYPGNTLPSGNATAASYSYLGKSAVTYPRWTSLAVTASNESLNVKLLDQAIYRVSGTPDFILADPAVMSQFRYEAEAMKKMSVQDDASYGHKRSLYMSDKGPIVILSPYYLYGTGRVYILNSKTFKTKGTIFTPQMIRGKLEVSQTSDIWFDDAITEFENICVQRNANTYITGLTAAW